MANIFVVKRDIDNRKTTLELLKVTYTVHFPKNSGTLVHKPIIWPSYLGAYPSSVNTAEFGFFASLRSRRSPNTS